MSIYIIDVLNVCQDMCLGVNRGMPYVETIAMNNSIPRGQQFLSYGNQIVCS